ncbi:MAG: thioredoxin [Bacteroidaceae bacterium]
MAQIINSSNLEQLAASGKLVVLDFWAPWCGPCRRIAPVIEALAEEYQDQAIIGKCNVEEDENLSMQFGVRNIPTILFIKNGEVKDKVVGLVPKQTLEDKLKALL